LLAIACKSSRAQLTDIGYSDDVYCECVTTISQFDVILQVLLVNQTTKVLQNMTVEFQTLGDLKLVERPAPHTLGPHGFHQIKATIKVSSTEVSLAIHISHGIANAAIRF
jgi:coatomer subunit beta